MFSSWLIHVCDTADPLVWRDSFVRVTQPIYAWRDSFVCVTWPIHVCELTDSYVWFDSSFIFIQECSSLVLHSVWLIHLWGITHTYVWHSSFIRVMWFIHTRDVTPHSYVYRCAARLNSLILTWLIRLCDVADLYVWPNAFICVKWHIWTHPYEWLDWSHTDISVVCVPQQCISAYLHGLGHNTGQFVRWWVYMYICTQI